jgi:hypothetical protein
VSQLPKDTWLRMRKLAFALGQIRLQVEEARAELDGLEEALDPRFARWRCEGCGYTKHFVKPASVEACDACPRCRGTAFSPVVD